MIDHRHSQLYTQAVVKLKKSQEFFYIYYFIYPHYRYLLYRE